MHAYILCSKHTRNQLRPVFIKGVYVCYKNSFLLSTQYPNLPTNNCIMRLHCTYLNFKLVHT